MVSRRDFITDSDEAIAMAIAERLEKALFDKGFVDPDESVIRQHGRIEVNDGIVEYYWDDELLFSTEPTHIVPGIVIK
jgi:hypothetical protein